MTMLASHSLQQAKQPPRENHALALSLLLAVALPSACASHSPDKPPATPPSVPVVATGDGTEVAGYFGPPGGEIQLSANGPSIVIPRDDKRAQGVALGLKKDAGSPDAAATKLGDAFRPTGVFEPPSSQFVDVWSLKLVALPAPCTPQNLELAHQEAQQVGPSDGASSPALSWAYEKARWEDQRVNAKLPKLSPYPLQFICARSPSGGGT
jgi:hypothetical protein